MDLYDEIVRLRSARGIFQFRGSGVRFADAQVVGDRAIEQPGILEHDRNVVAQRDLVSVANSRIRGPRQCPRRGNLPT